MEPGVYEEILRQLKALPTAKVLEAKHFIDFLEQQNKRQSQGYGPRFSDLYAPPSQGDDILSALLETTDEGYPGARAGTA